MPLERDMAEMAMAALFGREFPMTTDDRGPQVTCHPAYTKACGHPGWCACVRHRRHDAVQPLGDQPRDTEARSLHRAHRTRSAIRVGAESPLRRLDAPDVGIGQGDRVIVRGRYELEAGTALGPITLDNEGIWFVSFDNGREETFDYHLLERVYEL